MIVITKKTHRLRVTLSNSAKYTDVAESLRRLQSQPVGENIASIELNNGVIGIAGADGVHVPLTGTKVVEVDRESAKILDGNGGARLDRETDAGIRWTLIPGVDAVAVLLDLSNTRDVVEYSRHFAIRVARDGTITGVDRNGEIARGVYHVKTPSGEWRTLPKHTDIKDLVVKYGGDNYQET